MNWLDWLIIAVIALSALQGLRHGLVASVAKLAGILVGLGVAYTYYRPFAEYLSTQWNMGEKIMPLVEGLLKYLPSINTVPPALSPEKLTSTGMLTANQNQLNPFSDYLTQIFATGVLEALSFLVLLLATVWVVNLAGRILTSIANIALMGPLNHLGGLVFGVAKGLLVVMIVLTLISPFQLPYSTPGVRSGVPSATLPRGAFQDSRLLPYFEPLFKAINRPLPGFPPGNDERTGPVKNT